MIDPEKLKLMQNQVRDGMAYANDILNNNRIAQNKLLNEIADEADERRSSELASGYCERLNEAVIRFDAELDNDHEVALRLVSFGQAITFHVTGIGYHNPSLIMFFGTMDSGLPVELVQHISQISFLMTSSKRKDPCTPKRPFGFHSASVQDFTAKADSQGMSWDDSGNCWTDKNGNHFEKDGTPVKLQD